MRNIKVFIISLIISIILHISTIIIFYFLFENAKKITQNNDDKKVKLSFKYGGDIAKKDSQLKENTPISKQVTSENSASKTPKHKSSSMQKQQSTESKQNHIISKDSKPKMNYDLSKLEVFDIANISQNNQNVQNIQTNLNERIHSLPKDIQNDIMQLYGDELGDYGEAQQDFIINNLKDIGRITQYYLSKRGYPPDAGYLKQQGVNAVEFYLYPNGDISDLKIIKDSKSMILDKNTLTIIRIAYKDYPHPTIKTKIKIYVKYYLR